MFSRIRLIFSCNLLRAALLCLLVWLSGCARLPVAEPLPPGLAITGRLSLPAGSVFAWNPDGERVAVARDGIQIWSPASGNLAPFWPQAPTAMAWSPDGLSLAAALSDGESSRLVVIANGELRKEITIPGDIRSIFWRAGGEILCLATKLKVYSFGGNFQLSLHRWVPGEEPVSAVLHDVSLKPATLQRWGGLFQQTPGPSLSPFGDELLYARLHDPPEFLPYLKRMLRHLETDAEREVAVVPVTAGPALWAGDGEAVIYGDGSSIHTRDPWTGREGDPLSLPGEHLAASPGGRYLFADGRLHRDGALLATFPSETVASFSPRGGELLLQHKDHLFLLTGLEKEPTSVLPEAALEKLLLLRKWRSRGLLSPQEYLDQKERLVNP